MTQQLINVGTAPNDATGDPLRTAFTKINANFTEIYSNVQISPTGSGTIQVVNLTSVGNVNAGGYVSAQSAVLNFLDSTVIGSSVANAATFSVAQITGNLTVAGNLMTQAAEYANVTTVANVGNVGFSYTISPTDRFVFANCYAGGMSMILPSPNVYVNRLLTIRKIDQNAGQFYRVNLSVYNGANINYANTGYLDTTQGTKRLVSDGKVWWDV